jgi:hypothetical protein
VGHHRDQHDTAKNADRRPGDLAGEWTGPDSQQKEMMCHPTKEKAGGQIDEIDKDTTRLFDIKADELWQYCRYHGDREREDQSCPDIIP